MLPSSPVSWLLLLVAFTPGWCAVRGWFRGRPVAAPDMSQWWPAAVALGCAWTGCLAALIGKRLSATTTNHVLAHPVGVLLWLGTASALWLLPFWIGWLAGRLWPTSGHRRGDFVTVVFKEGSTAHGLYWRTSDDGVTLHDGSGGGYLGSAVEIARDDIQMIVSDPSQAVRATPAGSRACGEAAPGLNGVLEDATEEVALRNQLRS